MLCLECIVNRFCHVLAPSHVASADFCYIDMAVPYYVLNLISFITVFMFQTIFISFPFFCFLFWNLEALTLTLICLQFYDLLNIFDLNGLPSEENPYLFNGDFVDRGSFSLEVILTLFAFKCMCPSGIPSAILLLFVFSA